MTAVERRPLRLVPQPLPLRICYFGTYSAGEGYPVNRVLIAGLRRAGASVWECRAGDANEDEERWKSVRGPWSWIATIWKTTVGWTRLVFRWMTGPPTDVVVVGYPGHVDMFLARVLTRRPIALNALLSLYDTVVLDRRLLSERSMGAAVLARLDRAAFRAADLVLLDTETHIEHLSERVGVPRDRFARVFVGSDRSPRPAIVKPEGAPKRALFVGTFIPLHGVGTILDAAARLEAMGVAVTVRLIGRGQEFRAVEERIIREGLRGVELQDRWLNADAYERELAEADMCLGIFGATEKAGRVIPSKVYDALAAGRPVITADTPAARELLTHGEDAWLCRPADPDALAEGIARLAGDDGLRIRLAAGALRTYDANCSPAAIGRRAMEALNRIGRPAYTAASITKERRGP